MPSEDVNELRQAFESNPSEGFVPLAKALMESPESRREAREVCLRGLTANPQNRLGRLLLARAYYLDNMFEFAVRELIEIRSLGTTPGIEKLLNEFGALTNKYLSRTNDSRATTEAIPSAVASSSAEKSDGVVAELDLDTDFLEAIDEAKEDGV